MDEQALPDPMLLTWMGSYTHADLAHVTRATQLLHHLAPFRSLSEAAVIGRWFTWLLMIEHHTLTYLDLNLEQAQRYWRGLRAVAENRSAGTSVLGQALGDFVGNLPRLPAFSSGDLMLVSLAIGHTLDGLAWRYTWQSQRSEPAASSLLDAMGRSSGIYTALTLLSALRGWRLSEVLLNHPARRCMKVVEAVAGSLRLQPTSALPDTLWQALEQAFTPLDKQWTDYRQTSGLLLQRYQTWLASEQATDDASAE
ncbi:hypothetical protein [Herpetosiphon llansteffanensis]|uniref:hypothetical protein n=1 Tax=Herpetosiphon llansteffanensis TaxID=2094568 RepID=UPI000D7CF61F|nr:hypothetical protein [Herpetosiphon llansteffanensis]